MNKPEVTVVELTSGEIINLIELIECKIEECNTNDDETSKYLAEYYFNIAKQFNSVLERLNRDIIPEKRLAKLVMAL